jgi:orotate phosphoribosyltransferase
LTYAFDRLNPCLMQHNTQNRNDLRDILCQKSIQLGDFTLASGEKSKLYVDAKLTTCRPVAMPLIGRVFLERIEDRGWNPEAVGGLTVGADPIAYSIARESIGQTGRSINAFIVRKEAKKHGMGRYIEGLDRTEGLRVVIIEDACTKGGSTAQAVEKALEARMNIVGAICLVDREQGAGELLKQKFGIALESIFTLAELLTHKNELRAAEVPVGAKA